MKKKFTDNQLIELHSREFSDRKISKIFGCNASSIWDRRTKLVLLANFKPIGGKNLNEEELKNRRLKHIKKFKKYNKELSKEEKRESQRKSYYQNKERKLKWRKEYNQRPEIKKRNKEYRREYIKRPSVKEKIRLYEKEYREKHKPLIH